MGAVIQIGVDIGQKIDPSALAVAEIEKQGKAYHYLMRHIERLPLGTPYPAVVARLVAVKKSLAERGIRDVRWWVDSTGVGQPVVDLLQAAGIYPTAVYLTGNDKAVRDDNGQTLRLGKPLLVSRLQVLLQCGRIHLPKTPEAGALADELLNYEIRVSDEGQDSYGAFKVGTHDDLATALGLACWQEPQGWTRGPIDV